MGDRRRTCKNGTINCLLCLLSHQRSNSSHCAKHYVSCNMVIGVVFVSGASQKYMPKGIVYHSYEIYQTILLKSQTT